MKRALLGLAVSGAIASAAVPVVALVAMTPVHYGAFSLPYLFYALGNSLQLSVVCDPFVRLRGRTAVTWAGYSAMSCVVSCSTGLTVLIVGLALDLLRPEIGVLTVAVAIMLWRGGARFFALVDARFGAVILADMLAILGFAVGLTLGVVLDDANAGVAFGWLGLAIGGSVGLGLPQFVRHDGAVSWVSKHRTTIAPLLGDSLLMDAGAIGGPLLVARILGVAQFGTYRAVSNVALPVRLVLDPLRPLISSRPVAAWFRPRGLLVIGIATIALGAGAWLALAVLLPLLPVELGTLSSLTAYALPTAVFVAASFLGHFFYVVGRGQARGSAIAVSRIVQTILFIVLPVLGALAGGLESAIWGFSLATVISSFSWALTALPRHTRGG